MSYAVTNALSNLIQASRLLYAYPCREKAIAYTLIQLLRASNLSCSGYTAEIFSTSSQVPQCFPINSRWSQSKADYER